MSFVLDMFNSLIPLYKVVGDRWHGWARGPGADCQLQSSAYFKTVLFPQSL